MKSEYFTLGFICASFIVIILLTIKSRFYPSRIPYEQFLILKVEINEEMYNNDIKYQYLIESIKSKKRFYIQSNIKYSPNESIEINETTLFGIKYQKPD